MSLPPDAAEITAPRDPAVYRPRGIMGPTFVGMLGFGLLCVLAGLVVWTLAPRWLAGRPASQLERGPAVLQARAPSPAVAASTPVAPPITRPAASRADVAQLDAQLAALESREARITQAAAAALAAAALVEAAQDSRPFTEELAVLRGVSPRSPELAALTDLAEAGAPSRAALANSFSEYAARAASASRAPGEGSGLGDRIAHALSRVVALRRIGDVPGGGADALIARAELMVEDGDLAGAIRLLDRLPSGARDAMAPWRARAERRAEIDRQAAALRARALQALSEAAEVGA